MTTPTYLVASLHGCGNPPSIPSFINGVCADCRTCPTCRFDLQSQGHVINCQTRGTTR